jgi:hypothetical protein
MNTLLWRLVIILGVLFPVEAYAQSVQPATTWKNDKGSLLTIDSIDGTGELKGNYVNKAAGYPCQNTQYAVIGWVDDGKISFSVRWKNSTEDCKSITAWTGYLSGNRIISQWDLVYLDSTEKAPIIFRGTDVFTKQ